MAVRARNQRCTYPPASVWFFIILAFGLCAAPMKAAAETKGLAPIPVVPGPKRTIAVGEIEARGGFEGSANWNIGAGVSAMLATELQQSGRFYLSERTNLSELLTERKLQANMDQGGQSRSEDLIPAQYIVVGSVTEFGSPSKGSGVSIESPLAGVLGGLDMSRKKGKVSLDLRLVDARTGSVVDSFTVSAETSSSSVGLSSEYKGVSFGSDKFSKTPLGQATREAIHKAVVAIASAIARKRWEAKVVTFANGEVIINVGGEAGIKIGDRMRVERISEVLTDPSTGRVLDEQRYHIGNLEVTRIRPEVAYATFESSNGAATPVRGDSVIAVAAVQ